MTGPRSSADAAVTPDEFYERLARQPLQLSQAELVVIIRAVAGSDLPGDDHLLSDLEVSEADVQIARAGLVERKVLLPLLHIGGVVLEPALWPTISTALYPRTLGILQIRRPDRPPQTLYLSWGSWQAVLNKVEPGGTHLLQPLASAEAVADAVMRECGLDTQPSQAAATAPTAPVDPEAVARKATLRGLMLIVANPSRPREAAEALSWLLSDGKLWLIARRGLAGAALTPISAADLRRLLVALSDSLAGAGAVPA